MGSWLGSKPMSLLATQSTSAGLVPASNTPDSAGSGARGPLPCPPKGEGPAFTPSVYSEEAVSEVIASCKTPATRARLSALEPLSRRAAHTIAEMNYYPTRFPRRVRLYAEEHPRAPLLDLPFGADRFDGVVFVDEL